MKIGIGPAGNIIPMQSTIVEEHTQTKSAEKA